MNAELISKYGIDFQNRVYNGKIDKFPYASFSPLVFLLIEWNVTDIEDDDHGLLTDIEAALVDPDSEIEAGSTMVLIIIYQKVVMFYMRDNDKIDSMPTADLREVVIGWRDFLLQPPLNGSLA